MLEKEIKEAITRYDFLLKTLSEMNGKVQSALKGDNRWFCMAPNLCTKFLKQAVSLRLLFEDKQLELGNNAPVHFEDLSTIFTIVRMQFEMHALFFHLFMPCDDIEENVLRFRLWELEGIRSSIDTFASSTDPEHLKKKQSNENYEVAIVNAIRSIKYFQNLTEAKRERLIEKNHWRFSSSSLSSNDWKKPLSYKELILSTGLKPKIFEGLYAQLSEHTHPSYSGVLQNFNMSADDIAISRYVATMHAGFVTANMIVDYSKRFVEAGSHLDSLNEKEKEVLRSLRSRVY